MGVMTAYGVAVWMGVMHWSHGVVGVMLLMLSAIHARNGPSSFGAGDELTHQLTLRVIEPSRISSHESGAGAEVSSQPVSIIPVTITGRPSASLAARLHAVLAFWELGRQERGWTARRSSVDAGTGSEPRVQSRAEAASARLGSGGDSAAHSHNVASVMRQHSVSRHLQSHGQEAASGGGSDVLSTTLQRSATSAVGGSEGLLGRTGGGTGRDGEPGTALQHAGASNNNIDGAVTGARDASGHDAGAVMAQGATVAAAQDVRARDLSRRQLLRRGLIADSLRKRKGGLSSDALSTVHHMVDGRSAADGVAAVKHAAAQGGTTGGPGDSGSAVDAVVDSLKTDAVGGQLKMMRHLPSKHYFDDLPMVAMGIDDIDPNSDELIASAHASAKQQRSSDRKRKISVLDTVIHGNGGRGRSRSNSGGITTVSGSSSSAGHVLARTGGAVSVKASGSARLHGIVRERQEGLSDDEVASSLDSAAVAEAFEEAVAGDDDGEADTPTEAGVGLEDSELESLSSDKGLLWAKEHWATDDGGGETPSDSPSQPRRRRRRDASVGHRHHRGENHRLFEDVSGQHAALGAGALVGLNLSWLGAAGACLLVVIVLWLARKHPQVKRLHGGLQRLRRRVVSGR